MQVLSPGLCKGPWSMEEDALLVQLYYRGFRNWGEVAEKVEGRNAKQCRERWNNHLNPDLNKGDPAHRMCDSICMNSAAD